ncbi:MAG: hypothetical protein ACI4II_00210 [Acutalibacteraceae bacterium]
MGKYDEAIGSMEISIDVSDVIEEEEKENYTRIELAERLYNLVEEDIQCRQEPIFRNEEWAINDIEYYKEFQSSLNEYINHIMGIK